ncbi:hypothetical protein [Rhodococcus sp. OK302]|uniref:hypothetical protein n=1 Tax=Rhodococcus sp. OK302 TaxID=1882769 RepID=UPI000B942953|nr:hypothetical protein [Rhodococcus sp. OK302]OYD66999.1 hypothetical protein BDB13_0500 [Rhodococcus sp. OK302]
MASDKNKPRLTTGSDRAAAPAFIANHTISLSPGLQALNEKAATTRIHSKSRPVPSPPLSHHSAPHRECVELGDPEPHQRSAANRIAELGEHASPNARPIVGNVRAMQATLESSDAVDSQAILQMHQAAGSVAAGRQGFRTSYANIVDHDVTARVAGHSDYFSKVDLI